MSVPAAGEQQKLRGSCHACALSKVRCSKEKPICSRCTKRGTPCEYLVTRRPGRKQQENRPNARASASITNVQQTLPQPDVPTAFALPEDQPLSVPNTSSSSNFDMLSCLFDTVDPSLSTALMDWSTDFDGYLAVSPVSQTTSFDVLDPSQTVSSARTGSRSPSGPNGNSAPALVRPDDTISLFGRAPASGSQSSPNTHPLFTNNPGQSHRGSTCSCLPCALDLLKDIVASDPMRGPMSEKRTSECVGSSPPSIDTTIKTNQQTMDTINTILECGCSQDSYLLAIVALIIFKVLDTYATAATAPGPAVDSAEPSDPISYSSGPTLGLPTPIENESVRGTPKVRTVAAQRVLSELHRVQRAVSQLSPRLKAFKTQNMAGCADRSSLLGNNTSSAVSTTVMDQLEHELRKRLGALSLEIINMLRLDE